MTTVIIRGIPVKFPFTPYDIQTKYMEKVIDCLEDKQNGVLESPTGTGKTLCLLCASLAWLESKKTQCCKCNLNDSASDEDSEPPTIIYASRTHTQIQQAMQEMKRTDYNYMRAVVLGSRDQMCIHPDIIDAKDNSEKLKLCKSKIKNKSCLYYTRVEQAKRSREIVEKNILDMEDIVELGRCKDFCPYFMARQLKADADIVFMPYNYLLDFKTQKIMDVKCNNNIVILDEAHNIEKVCEDAASSQISSTEIAHAIEDVAELIEALRNRVISSSDEEVCFNIQNLTYLHEMLGKFKKSLDDVTLVRLASEGTYFEGDYIYTMLESAGMNHKNFNGIMDLIEEICNFFATTNITFLQRSGYCLELFANLLTIPAYNSTPEYKQKVKECFKVHIDEEQKQFSGNWYSQPTQQEKCRVLNMWCFSPGFGMKMLMDQGIHSLILTSGTLAPLKPLISELEIDVGVRIENPHIVQGDQVCVTILSKGPDQEPLNCNYQNRNNPKYLRSLGIAISNLVRTVPHGALIFFPSYYILEKCINFWEESGIWKGINSIKPIFVEPKDKHSFTAAMTGYYEQIQNPEHNGAIFMGVCRGKVSEGLDFADINGRAVFIIGLPYPPLKDAKVILKKKYLDFRNSQNREYLRGNDWYSLQATRAINQAIGRVIRHRHDYGAIILLDSRFTNPQIKSNMSLWLQNHIKCATNFGEIVRNLRSFFQTAQEKLPAPQPKDFVQSVPLPMVDLTCEYFDNDDNDCECEDSLVTIHKRENYEDEDLRPSKRQK